MPLRSGGIRVVEEPAPSEAEWIPTKGATAIRDRRFHQGSGGPGPRLAPKNKRQPSRAALTLAYSWSATATLPYDALAPSWPASLPALH